MDFLVYWRGWESISFIGIFWIWNWFKVSLELVKKGARRCRIPANINVKGKWPCWDQFLWILMENFVKLAEKSLKNLPHVFDQRPIHWFSKKSQNPTMQKPPIQISCKEMSSISIKINFVLVKNWLQFNMFIKVAFYYFSFSLHN